jgi:ubiquinone/menaquinone biosynthesis C-methylase UbiE
MSEKDSKYIPAFSYSSLTPIYDSLMKYAMRESVFKNRLANQVRLGKGRMMLDLGCGTATLTISIKKTFPETEAVGIDGDAEILKIAREKINMAVVDITLNRGAVFELPYVADSFDCVVSS